MAAGVRPTCNMSQYGRWLFSRLPAPGCAASRVSGFLADPSLPRSSSTPAVALSVLLPVAPGHVLHSFSVHCFDAGPVRLSSIAHAFFFSDRCVTGWQ